MEEATQEHRDRRNGHPLKRRSLETVRFLRKQFGDQLTIIGAGGIMTGEDAVEIKQAGTDSIEIYSAFICSGPAVPKEMARALMQKPG
jgi:dihydroorotate dehydrogenase